MRVKWAGKICIALVIVVSLGMTACSWKNNNMELNSGERVLYTQLKNNYYGSVNYSVDNKEEIEEAVNKLLQGYIMGEEEYKESIAGIEVHISDRTIEDMVEFASRYSESEYYEQCEELKAQAEEMGAKYEAPVNVNFTRECIIAKVRIGTTSKLIKLKYEKDGIGDMVTYEY